MILGVHKDAVGWIRGGTPAKAKMWRSTGVAADSFYTSALGCVAAAFGPIEAQGRGSLHPHILVWLLLISMTDAIDVLMRDRAAFKERIRDWMQAVIAAIVTTQETSVATRLTPHLRHHHRLLHTTTNRIAPATH